MDSVRVVRSCMLGVEWIARLVLVHLIVGGSILHVRRHVGTLMTGVIFGRTDARIRLVPGQHRAEPRSKRAQVEPSAHEAELGPTLVESSPHLAVDRPRVAFRASSIFLRRGGASGAQGARPPARPPLPASGARPPVRPPVRLPARPRVARVCRQLTADPPTERPTERPTLARRRGAVPSARPPIRPLAHCPLPVGRLAAPCPPCPA